jgi:NifU-like protein involved in Fe-S cluster formation
LGGPRAGPFMIICLKLEGAMVRNSIFETCGYPGTIVAGSVLTKYVNGKDATNARSVDARPVLDLLGGLPSERGTIDFNSVTRRPCNL